MASNSTKDEIYRKYLDGRMAEQIRASSQELRALETKIRSAYVNKALRAQLAEKEKARLEQHLRQQNENEQLNQTLMAEKERKRQQKELARGEQMKLRGELQKQIVEKCRKRKLLYEEFLKEKLVIDEIIRKIQMEQIEYVSVFQFQQVFIRRLMDGRDNAFYDLQRISAEAIAIEMSTRRY